VIGAILGIPEELADTFTGWVRDVLEFADDAQRVERGMFGIGYYLWDRINERRDADGDDLLTYLLHAEVDDGPVDDMVILGMAILTMIAGIDTTWSAIGSSLWHLATHGEDRRRLVADPGLMDTAVEELLRAYAPVTMARVVTGDIEFEGCPMRQGDKVLLNFPAANRDPSAFDRADEVLLDRQENRHVAFGSGIHRCAGSNLARMELRVALEEWLTRVPEFRLAEGAEVLWAGGQVRGPRRLDVVFG
jgi:cytochrome P450